jgi:hypothetical protein
LFIRLLPDASLQAGNAVNNPCIAAIYGLLGMNTEGCSGDSHQTIPSNGLFTVGAGPEGPLLNPAQSGLNVVK